MYYVYVLRSERDKKFYIGFTKDLKQRIEKHKKGQVTTTKNRLPIKLIFCEIYLSRKDAKRREKFFKTTKGKATLKILLKSYLKSIN